MSVRNSRALYYTMFHALFYTPGSAEDTQINIYIYIVLPILVTLRSQCVMFRIASKNPDVFVANADRWGFR